jgi:hypothetical protein
MGESRRYRPNSELVNDESCACDLGAATSLGVDSSLWIDLSRVLTMVGLRERSIGLSTEWRPPSKEARHARRRSFEGIA